MKKILFTLIISIIFFSTQAYSQPCEYNNIPHKLTHKQQKEFQKTLETELELTSEQKEALKVIRAKHKKQMEKTVSKMQELHDKIRNVYLTGIPSFQADLKTAHLKAELVILKQNAEKIRNESKKSFESILTPEQKIKLENLKKERSKK